MKFFILVLASFLTMAFAIPVSEAEVGLPQVHDRQPVDNPPPVVDREAVAESQVRFPPPIRPPPTCVCVTSPCPCDRPTWGK